MLTLQRKPTLHTLLYIYSGFIIEFNDVCNDTVYIFNLNNFIIPELKTLELDIINSNRLINLEINNKRIKKKSGSSINPDIHHSKVPSSGCKHIFKINWFLLLLKLYIKSLIEICVLRVETIFAQTLVDILPLGSGYICGSGS